MTATPEQIIIDKVVDEVAALCDRIVVLRTEGNAEGSEELAREAEAIVSENLKGNRKGFVAARKTARTGISRAMETEPATPSADVEVMHSTEVEVADVEWLNELVHKGSDQVRIIAETKVRGGRSLAELMFDIWRRVSNKDGLPDLKGSSHLAKTASARIYSDVLDTIPEDDTEYRTAITKLQKDVQNARNDVRVEYIRALDEDGNEDAKMFESVPREDGQSLSEAVAAQYKIKLMTRAEIEAERRAAKELESGSAGGAGGDEDGEPGEMNREIGPVDAVLTVVDLATRATGVIDAATIAKCIESGEIPADVAKVRADELKALIVKLSEIHSALI